MEPQLILSYQYNYNLLIFTRNIFERTANRSANCEGEMRQKRSSISNTRGGSLTRASLILLKPGTDGLGGLGSHLVQPLNIGTLGLFTSKLWIIRLECEHKHGLGCGFAQKSQVLYYHNLPQASVSLVFRDPFQYIRSAASFFTHSHNHCDSSLCSAKGLISFCASWLCSFVSNLPAGLLDAPLDRRSATSRHINTNTHTHKHDTHTHMNNITINLNAHSTSMTRCYIDVRMCAVRCKHSPVHGRETTEDSHQYD